MQFRFVVASLLLLPSALVVACEDDGGSFSSGSFDAGSTDGSFQTAETSVIDVAAPDADADAAFYPATCAEILVTGITVDADYMLYVDHNPVKPWTAYCYGMSSSDAGDAGDAGATGPLEYLAVPAATNFSVYTAGGSSPGTDVTTSFTRVRIEPLAFVIHGGDERFATSTGALIHSGSEPVSSMPFATSASCGGPDATGQIDLRNTPFTLAPGLIVLNALGTGTATYASSQEVTMSAVNGFCGYMSPAPGFFNPFNTTDVLLPVTYGAQPDGGDGGDGG